MVEKKTIRHLALQLGKILYSRQLYVAVAESCTGGSLAAAITDIPGSSQWFDRGFVTYTNESKEQMLGVNHNTLVEHGAVSGQTAKSMAEGVIAFSKAQISVAITGIAGPGGGSISKPVGTVWIAWSGGKEPTGVQCYAFNGSRTAIRKKAVHTALQGLINRCE